MSKNWIYLLVLSLFSFVGMKALLHPGLFTAHDISHQVVRLYYYSQAVNDGQLPPYWIGQLAKGFGYPLFLFSYHFPWIIGTTLLSAGFDFSSTIKALFFTSYLGSGIGMYFLVKSLLKDKLSALLSAILYLWLPYHFLIIFVSASMGVAFIFTFLPIILLGIHLLRENSKFGIPVLSLGISGIILSHIMHTIFLSPIILIFLLWEFRNSKQRIIFLKRLCLGITLGFIISSFYLLPALFYKDATRVNQETGFYELYKRHFVNLNQLVYSKWGVSPIVNNAKTGEISFQLGITQWISVIILSFLLVFKRVSKLYYSLSIYLLTGLIISIFLMLDYSISVWSFFVKIVAIDYPFRLLLPASFIASICGGIVIASLKDRLRIVAFAFLISAALYTNRNHINVNQYTDFPISTYLDLETEITTNTFNEYLPINIGRKLLTRPWNEIAGENVSASGVKQRTNLLTFNVSSSKEGTASAGQFFFPGQVLYIDKKIAKTNTDGEGRIGFNLPEGNHTITVKYEETLLIQLSKILTITGILTVLFLLLKKITFTKS